MLQYVAMFPWWVVGTVEVAGASKHFFGVHGETAFGGNWA